MRVLLHIGMPKAGSTALQTGLASLRGPLLDSGVLYPPSPIAGMRHPLLIVGLTSAKRLPRYLRQRYNGRLPALEADAEAWRQQVASTARDRKAATLILSEESLFTVKDPDSVQMLARRLRSLGDPVDVVAYVRRPSDHFLSMAQQTLRASHEIRQPQPTPYCATLDGYAEHTDSLRVIPYDRTAWPGGDILRHFLHTFIPEVDVKLEDLPQLPNESISAEAMSILAEYRRTFWSEAHNQFTPDTASLIQALKAADAEVGGSRRPRLHERIRRFVDASSTDLLPLRDEYGVVFDDIDYESIGTLPGPAPTASSVEDLCPVDAGRRAELALHAMRQLAEAASRDPSGREGG